MHEILAIIADFYEVNLESLKEKGRQAKLTRIHHIAMYIMRETGKFTLEEIGKFFNRDHATVLFAVNAIKSKMEEIDDDKLSETVEFLQDEIKTIQRGTIRRRYSAEEVIEGLKEEIEETYGKSPEGIAQYYTASGLINSVYKRLQT